MSSLEHLFRRSRLALLTGAALFAGTAGAQHVLWDALTGIPTQLLCDYCITSVTDQSGNLVVIATGEVSNQQNTRVVRFELDGSIDWERTIDTSEARGIALDPGGNILVVGSAQFNGSPLTITKYTTAGVIAWQRVLLSGYSASGIGSDAQGNVFVVGTQAGRMFAMKHDAAGAFEWSTPIDPPSGTSEGRAIVVLPSGDSVIAGHWRDGGAGTGGTLLARIAANGDVAWQDDTTLAQTIYSLALDRSANAVASGGDMWPGGGPPQFQVLKYSAAGVFQWSRDVAGRFGGRAYQVAVDSADDIVAVGTVNYPSFRSTLVTAKFDPGGTLLWSREIDTAGAPTGIGPGHALLLTAADEVVVAGYSEGGSGIRVAQYDRDGDLVWDLAHNPIPATGSCAFDIAPAPEDAVYVSGVTDACIISGELYAVKIQDGRIFADGFE